MYISKLNIKNFKCFEDVEIEFDPNFNLIIGENNSGKSTVFEALRLWQIAIQQFYNDRTGKKGDGSKNMGFYKSYSFKPLQISDLSFLRIEDLNNVLHNKTSIIREDELEFETNDSNSFTIELTFSDSILEAKVPIIFRTNNKNTLSCKIQLPIQNGSKDINENELIKISHSLSKVMELANNASFKNRIRLAYIPPKFTLPNKEVLISERNALILEKLIFGESQLVIRNILHHWCELSYQIKTKKTSNETINNAKSLLKEFLSENVLKNNFEKKFKPYIEHILEYNVQPKRKQKSKFLSEIEKGLKEIIGQTFDFISDNDPIDNYSLQIKNGKDKTEISQLGSGTINILNILTVLNYNEQTIDKAATKCNVLLLDEPDSHLHSNLQINLYKYLELQSKESSKQIFIITHNSSLISQFDKLLYIESKKNVHAPISINVYLENHLKNIDENHYNVIKELNDSKKIKDEIEKQLNEISKPTLFCEGSSDVTILKEAYKKLYDQTYFFDGKLEITDAGGASFVTNNLRYNTKSSLFLIGLFDNDFEGNSQKKTLENEKFKKIDDWHYQKHFKKDNNSSEIKLNNHFFMLPIPQARIDSSTYYEENGFIEYMFDDLVLETKLKVELIVEKGRNHKVIRTERKGGKHNYSVTEAEKKKVTDNIFILNRDDFKNFIPLFEKIAEIINFSLPI